MLRLSIIVNMYNTAKYMDRCMETLLNQDIPISDYEIIMVDDCSPDNSLEMAKDYATQYPNIKVLHHDHNRGLAAGRNTGVDAAEGKYLCFVDPDDYIEKNSLAALLEQMEAERLDMLRFNYQKVNEQYEPLADVESEAMFDYSSGVMTGEQFLSSRLGIACYVWPYIYRTELIKGSTDTSPIRFVEGVYLDDTPWLPRVLMRARRIDCINTRRYYYLQRGDSMVRIQTPAAIEKKLKGQKQLIPILTEQQSAINNEGVKRWYRAMISQITLGLININIVSNYAQVRDTIVFLRQTGAFPLEKYKATKKALRKIRLINLSPELYCQLMHVKFIISSHQSK